MSKLGLWLCGSTAGLLSPQLFQLLGRLGYLQSTDHLQGTAGLQCWGPSGCTFCPAPGSPPVVPPPLVLLALSPPAMGTLSFRLSWDGPSSSNWGESLWRWPESPRKALGLESKGKELTIEDLKVKNPNKPTHFLSKHYDFQLLSPVFEYCPCSSCNIMLQHPATWEKPWMASGEKTIQGQFWLFPK